MGGASHDSDHCPPSLLSLSRSYFGDQEHVLDDLLVYSQVFLSAALPFSIFPLVYFTSNKEIMGEHVNAKWNTFLGYLVAIVLTILNFNLIVTTFIK